jgi:hypothetical protein
MTLSQGADYSLTEGALTPFQAEPTQVPGRRITGRALSAYSGSPATALSVVDVRLCSGIRCPCLDIPAAECRKLFTHGRAARVELLYL